MRCLADGCRQPAVCRYCQEHRPAGLPVDLERPSVDQDDDTVDLRLEMEAERDRDSEKLKEAV